MRFIFALFDLVFLRARSTAMVMSGQSVDLTTPFLRQPQFNQYSLEQFFCHQLIAALLNQRKRKNGRRNVFTKECKGRGVDLG